MTITDALNEHAPGVAFIVSLDNDLSEQLKAAMKAYAEEKARDFARYFYLRATEHGSGFSWASYIEQHPLE